jgi:hypothetical protein
MSRRSQRWKQAFVRALIAQATIKRFHKSVLLGMAGRDVMLLDLGILASGQNGMTGQLGARPCELRVLD